MDTVTRPRKLAGAWYLVGLGLVISALTMGVVAWTSMRNGIDGMQRFAAPGKTTATLPAGISTLFVEGDAKTTCAVQSAKVLPANGEVTYDSGGHAGRNVWDLDVVEAGDYTIVCEADRPVTIAVGRGIGAANVVVWISAVPAAIGLLVIAFVFWRRRR